MLIDNDLMKVLFLCCKGFDNNYFTGNNRIDEGNIVKTIPS